MASQLSWARGGVDLIDRLLENVVPIDINEPITELDRAEVNMHIDDRGEGGGQGVCGCVFFGGVYQYSRTPRSLMH